MTTTPPDPDPREVPGVEPGGGVPPGETPPDSPQTRATANPDPAAGRNLNPRMVMGVTAIAVFAILFAVVAVYYLIQVLG